MKDIGTDAREKLEKQLGYKIFLSLWVKVKPDWQKKIEEHYLSRAFTNSEVLRLGERTDLLGTQDLVADYIVGPDGIPVMNGGYYTFSVNFELVFNMDIETDVVDEDGNVISHSAEIHYGDICHPYRTDNSTYVDVKMSDGRIARFKFGTNPSGWGYMLNDISQDDIFQSIMYAG